MSSLESLGSWFSFPLHHAFLSFYLAIIYLFLTLLQDVSDLIREVIKVEILSLNGLLLCPFYKNDGQLVEVKRSEKVADLLKYCGTDYNNPLMIGYNSMFSCITRQ